ncbi:hypothetical protein CICLE_v10017427mg [Citrus x clementina]|uniref:Uncharacterized protein n=1 Tax=Citrus clementina TaxID=85681 RepID=V4TNL4_CITCL|nr:hypothetical protein CICLE_v10017427mg [Citrus x clementina]
MLFGDPRDHADLARLDLNQRICRERSREWAHGVSHSAAVAPYSLQRLSHLRIKRYSTALCAL